MVIDDRADEDPEDDTLYIVGRTNSNDFPSTAGSAQPTHGLGRPLHDGFVARLNLDLALRQGQLSRRRQFRFSRCG